MKKSIKITVIGAGSGYTPELIVGFIKRYHEMPANEIWLVDVEEGLEKLQIVTALCERIIKKSGLPIKINATTHRREALEEADFVLTQIRAGQMESRIKDENIPIQYNVVGQETNGPGEIFNAFRTIPVMLEIVEDMEKYCPDAWLINFANPAGILAEAVLNHTNWEKIISICNGPLNIENQIADALEVNRKRLYVEFVGLNHLVFAQKILLDGQNITSEVVKKVSEKEYSVDTPGVGVWNSVFLKGLKSIPMSYLQYYWKTKEVLEEEKKAVAAGGSRAVAAQKMEKELFKVYEDPTLATIPEELRKRGGSGYSECACDLILSIHTDKRDIQTVNTRNNGAIQQLELMDVVEVNCVITKGGPIPLVTEKVAPAMIGIIQQMKAFEKVVCEAAVTGDYELACVAMTMNPLVPSDQLAQEILDEMFLAHESYLTQFDLSHLKRKK